MAYREMDVAPVKQAGNENFSAQSKDVLTDDGTGDAVLVPGEVQGLAYQLSFTGTATGKVQATLSTVADVKADEAVWEDWALGEITDQSTNSDTSVPLTAFRVVKTGGTGTVTLAVRGQ